MSKKKGLTLILTEGKTDKKVLEHLLFLFPELNISDQKLIVLNNTNIYQLYDRLKEEYGFETDLSTQDIDLAVVLKDEHPELDNLRKNSFINTLLIFDFDPQDRKYSEDKITELMAAFSDETDNGKLYLNYPMLESLFDIPDFNNCNPSDLSSSPFFTSRFRIKNENGIHYKSTVKQQINSKYLMRFMDVPESIRKELKKISLINSEEIIQSILLVPYSAQASQEIEALLKKQSEDDLPNSLVPYINSLLFRDQTTFPGPCFYEIQREVIKKAVILHLKKALLIQNLNDPLYELSMKSTDSVGISNFDSLAILKNQNGKYRQSSEVFILNTSILFISDYNPEILGFDY